MLRVHERPIVGSWYRDVDHDERFEIVALDEDSQTIEIQYFGGEIEELDFDMWNALHVVSIPPPEDWSGPYDDVDKELYTVLKDNDLPSFEIESPLKRVE